MNIKKELDMMSDRIIEEVVCVECAIQDAIIAIEELEKEKESLLAHIDALEKIKSFPTLKLIK